MPDVCGKSSSNQWTVLLIPNCSSATQDASATTVQKSPLQRMMLPRKYSAAVESRFSIKDIATIPRAIRACFFLPLRISVSWSLEEYFKQDVPCRNSCGTTKKIQRIFDIYLTDTCTLRTFQPIFETWPIFATPNARNGGFISGFALRPLLMFVTALLNKGVNKTDLTYFHFYSSDVF